MGSMGELRFSSNREESDFAMLPLALLIAIAAATEDEDKWHCWPANTNAPYCGCQLITRYYDMINAPAPPNSKTPMSPPRSTCSPSPRPTLCLAPETTAPPTPSSPTQSPANSSGPDMTDFPTATSTTSSTSSRTMPAGSMAPTASTSTTSPSPTTSTSGSRRSTATPTDTRGRVLAWATSTTTLLARSKPTTFPSTASARARLSPSRLTKCTMTFWTANSWSLKTCRLTTDTVPP